MLLEKYEEYIPSFGHLLLCYKSQEERMVIETEKVEKYGLQSFLEGGYDQAHARGKCWVVLLLRLFFLSWLKVRGTS